MIGRTMKTAIALAFAILLIPFTSAAAPIQTTHDKALKYGTSGATGGELITAQSINVAKYTGWFYVGDSHTAVLAVDYTNDSGTAVTMTCQSSFVNTTANGSGYDVHEITAGASAVYTWSNAVTGDEKWTWSIYNVPLPWLNCAFAATSGGVDDVITVTVLGISP